MAKKFKCSKCDRKFSMAAHLARHMASHGGNRAVGRKSRRGPGRPRGSRNVAKSTVASAGSYSSGSGIDNMIREMNDYRDQLTIQRDALDTEIQSINTAMDALSSSAGLSAGPRRPGRPRSSTTNRRINAAMTRARRREKVVGALHAGGKRRRGRPTGSTSRNTGGSLKLAILKVVQRSSGSMSPKQIATAVQASGYKSFASDLTKLVSNTLPEIDAIKKVGRGQYKA